jgi:hypothetical protein
MTSVILAAVLVAAPNDFSVKGIAIKLPDGWSRVSNGEQLIFRHASGKYQLTISELDYAKPGQRQDFERILQLRLDAEKAGGGIATAEPIETYQSGFTARFAGAGSQRLFAGRLMMASGAIVTAYFEGVQVTPKEFAEMGAVVLAGVQIKPR